MPNRNTSYHDLDDVQGSVGPGPYPVTADLGGYGESGGIEFSVEGNLHEKTVGADGHVAISKVNDESVVATITCMDGTILCKDLARLSKLQLTADVPVGVPFFMLNPHLGDKIVEKEAWFQTIAAPTQADTHSEREFELILPHARSEIVLASNIAG